MIGRILGVGLLTLVSGFGAFWFASGRRAGPSIDVPSQIDLGLQDPRRQIETRFYVANRGQQPLELSQFQTTCGCLGLSRQAETGPVEVGTETIPPGGRLEFALRLHVLANSTNRFQHAVHFRTNDPARPDINVVLTGEVRAGIYAVPREISLGVVRPGEVVTRSFYLVDARRPDVRKLFQVRSPSAAVTVDRVAPAERSDEIVDAKTDCQIYQATITVMCPKDAAEFQVALTVAEDEGDAWATVPVVGSDQRRVRLAPSAVVLPRSSGSGLLYQARCLCQSDGQKLILTLVESPADLRVRIKDSAGDQSKVVEIECDPSKLPTPGTKSIVLAAETEDGVSDPLELSVTIARPNNP